MFPFLPQRAGVSFGKCVNRTGDQMLSLEIKRHEKGLISMLIRASWPLVWVEKVSKAACRASVFPT